MNGSERGWIADVPGSVREFFSIFTGRNEDNGGGFSRRYRCKTGQGPITEPYEIQMKEFIPSAVAERAVCRSNAGRDEGRHDYSTEGHAHHPLGGVCAVDGWYCCRLLLWWKYSTLDTAKNVWA